MIEEEMSWLIVLQSAKCYLWAIQFGYFYFLSSFLALQFNQCTHIISLYFYVIWISSAWLKFVSLMERPLKCTLYSHWNDLPANHKHAPWIISQYRETNKRTNERKKKTKTVLLMLMPIALTNLFNELVMQANRRYPPFNNKTQNIHVQKKICDWMNRFVVFIYIQLSDC